MGKRSLETRIIVGFWSLILLLGSFPGLSTAQVKQENQVQQELFNGIVLDLQTDQPIQYATITNLSSGQEVESGEQGQFSILAKINDLLQFYYPGYRTDTLVLTEFQLKRVYLTVSREGIRIDEINIRTITDAQLDIELEKAEKEGQFSESSITRGGLRISPSRLFGQAGRQARERYDLLIREKERRIIDRRFSVPYIQSITPLQGEDLVLYMNKYRPTREFVLSSDEQTFMLYIMDSYAAFKKLTPEEKAAIIIDKNDG